MKPKFFKTQSDFRKWLEKNYNKETELIVGYYKVGSAKPSITWSESVDQALCFGWIDSIRRTIDHESYQIRFTRRREDSIWSDINIKKVEDLTQKGLMHSSGLEIFKKRKEHKSGIYSYENTETVLPKEFEKIFKANKLAWAYFQSLAPSYKKLSINHIMSAKMEATKIKRLQEMIANCEKHINKWKNNPYTKK